MAIRSEVGHILTNDAVDGWESLGETVKGKLERWLAESEQSLAPQNLPAKNGDQIGSRPHLDERRGRWLGEPRRDREGQARALARRIRTVTRPPEPACQEWRSDRKSATS